MPLIWDRYLTASKSLEFQSEKPSNGPLYSTKILSISWHNTRERSYFRNTVTNPRIPVRKAKQWSTLSSTKILRISEHNARERSYSRITETNQCISSRFWVDSTSWCTSRANAIRTSFSKDKTYSEKGVQGAHWWKSQRSQVAPRKYVFDVTSVGQRSSPWTCNSVKVEKKIHLECKLYFPSAQLMLRQMHLTKVSRLSIEFLGWVLTSNKREYELWKLPLDSSFCDVTADPKSRCPHGRRAYFRGVVSCSAHYVFIENYCAMGENTPTTETDFILRIFHWDKRKPTRGNEIIFAG